MSVDWKLVSPESFELLCARLLETQGFKNVIWHGVGGSDRGRDLTARKSIKLTDTQEYLTSWAIQCKRYIKNPPSKSELNEWVASCKEHQPDYALLIHTSNSTSATKDWLAKSLNDYPFKVLIWERRDIERELVIHRSVLVQEFPELYRTDKPVLDLYPAEPGKFSFVLTDFEVEISAYNCNNEVDAEIKIRRFLEQARSHDFIFLTGRPPAA